ncbi:MAG TPA: bifunctional diaminohydroxyphosphoribosylaminopyrimidine deaminase/5-amino-6-(5-phosphoribosylamino)uracil reductase RibD [Candidatus Omnitrophota bacterium]|nr:bifunctional diaminohydroxyphosphoribosylaminopyrimidine deaminase/5-amino-6-(5-phosphoribosylamino)uracil reductase RibD [Candidatus Omnitrophota bacterium]HRZ66939.1 bifunctional diaminohydroxyphosphoribosylaminopyrimidine deaminase/5-amino-6-(5-phosphoribosylamino)uracil reductase RibD [Candidatus Omnitrophota bacterium]
MRKEDKKYISAAITLASAAKGRTSPNPCVGAVVVRAGRIVGKGYHRHAGGPHAEVYALKQAGKKARGATLYVSLEPCRHYGRTPPCVDMIKEYGIRRVVAAMKDPNPLNNGKGLAALRKCGIKAESGIMRQEARELNRPFIKYMEERMPFVIVKAAQTLDGKIATRTGDSKWVSNGVSRRFAHKLRSEADAVIVGSNTVVKDDPLLTARIGSGKAKQPLRVVLAGRNGIPKASRVLHSRGGEALVIMPDKETGKVDLKRLLRGLAGRGVMNVLIEGGGEVIASALRQKVVDKVYFFIAPKISGGREAKTSVEGEGIAKMKDSIGIRGIKLHDMAGDILVEGYVRR